MNKYLKKIKSMLGVLAIVTISFFLIVMGILLFYSPGKLKPYTDVDGARLSGNISEKTFVTIGGVKQGMFIKGKDLNNPVLLYIHGGPGFPNYFLFDKYDPGLEDYFTVCYWEQRGGGLSYSPEVSLQSMTFDQLTSDAVEVTNYLRNRFGKEKIFMMAHSGGTPIALKAASQNPELFNAYIAMAQITDQAESERIAYRYILGQYQAKGNERKINQLKKYDVLGSDSGTSTYYHSKIRDESMHELGIGTMHKMRSIYLDIFIPVWFCKAYTLSEKVKIWKSKFTFIPRTHLNSELLSRDFTNEIKSLDIPVYFISGKYDLTVNIELSRAYLARLKAPIKGFYMFDNSAHSPLFEEPVKFRQIIEVDILNLNNSLANDRYLK